MLDLAGDAAFFRIHPVKVVIGVGFIANPFREELESFDSVHGILEVLHTVCQIQDDNHARVGFVGKLPSKFNPFGVEGRLQIVESRAESMSLSLRPGVGNLGRSAA
jgi:hypothetical protein